MTPYQRIKRILKFYYDRGQNRESVNKVYRNILKKYKQKKTLIDIMQFDEKIGMYKDSKYYENQFKVKDYGKHSNN
jgi:hypothetical protein